MEGKKWVRRLGVVLAVAAVAFGVGVWQKASRPPPPARYVTAGLDRGDVVETVQSTGQVKPLTEVQVGAQVSGRVTRVFVDWNSAVKAGDVIAEIDPTLFGAQIEGTQAQLASANASVTRANANLLTARQRLDRAKKLVAEGIGTQADLDAASGAHDVALAELAAAKAQVTQIGAQLRSSKTNMTYTKIVSPIDGVVVSRNIDPGQTVAASFQAPVLFVIAQDLRKMRVLADVDEADVGRIEEGMRAEITVDAFPGERFEGSVSQVRFSPQTVAGVVTYAAVVEVDNPELKLRPGMTATVTARSAEAKGVRLVPNAALRFKPSPGKYDDGRPKPATLLPALPPGRARVHVLVDGAPGAERIELREVEVGVSDGVKTELKTDLGGLPVVTDETDDAEGKGGRKRSVF